MRFGLIQVQMETEYFSHMKHKLNKYIVSLAIVALTILPVISHAQVSSQFWKYISTVLQPNVVGMTQLKVPAIVTGGGTECLHISNVGVITATGADCGAGGGGINIGDPIGSSDVNQILYVDSGNNLANSFDLTWDDGNKIFQVGDVGSASNGMYFELDDSNLITKVQTSTGLKFLLDEADSAYAMGDLSGTLVSVFSPSGSKVVVSPDNAVASVLANGYGLYQLGDVTQIGDVDLAVNGTRLTIDDATGKFTFSTQAINIGPLNYVFPSSYGGVGDVLTDTDGAGTLEWQPGGGGGSGTVTDITLTQPSAGLTVSGSGVPCTTSCSFTFALGNDLAGLEGLSTNGVAVRTGTSTWATRTITGTSNRISITDGDGVSANPTIDISGSYVGQSSITTLGTIGTGTWQGTVIGGTYGGTGVNNGSNTITLAGNLVTSGANSLTLTTTGTTNVTLPTTGTLSTLAGTETLTNKRITKRVVALSDATSATLPMDTADMATMANTQAAGTFTMNAPSGTPTDGQQITFRIKSTNVQTFSWNGIFRGSNDYALPIATTGGTKTDYYGFIYNNADTRYDLVAVTKGF